MDNRKQPAEGGSADKMPAKVGESVDGNAAVVTTDINDDCILFGRGKACNNHPANKRMRQVIGSYRDKYLTAGRGEKKMLVLKVHRQLVEEGLKFLKQEEGIDGWIEAGPDEAITKVGHAIRCNRNYKGKSETDNNDQPQPAKLKMPPAVVGPEASAHGLVPPDNSVRVVQDNATASLALSLAGVRTAASTGFLSSGALGHQHLLGLHFGSSPLLPLESIRMHMNGLYPSLSASIGLAQQPPPPRMNGLSAAEIFVLLERERLLRQAML